MSIIPVFRAPPRAVKRVFIHCSASDNPAHDDVAVMRRWHVTENGWADVGYHYYIQKTGDVQAGRPLNKTPAAQEGHNSGTMAICVGGLAKDRFTPAQFASLRALCEQIHRAIPGVTFHGHKEVAKKDCPVFDYRKVLRLDAKGRMQSAEG
jgi:N-acetylmuramoyl-L-alanine amidase